MSEEIPSDQTYKPRSALGDVTNQVGKRGFPFVSTPGLQSGDGCKKDEGFQSSKKECLRVDHSQKENFHNEISAIASISKISCEIKEPCSPDATKSITSSASKVGDVMRDGCVRPTSPSDRNASHVTVEAEENERTDSVFVPQNPSKEKLENNSGIDDGDDDACLDNLYSSKDEYLDCSKFPESQESRCGLEIKGDGFSSMCMDSIKACPCSFCMKAAYLWSDLHYQDIKGRIAAIKKSQKEASILVHQNSKEGGIGRCGEGNSEKFSNLESDLTGRWMSLFVHMEDIFAREGTQLETSLSILRELRDNCKGDSEEH